MVLETIVSLAIQARSPMLAPRRADYMASAILYAAGENVDDIAALIVTGERESGWLGFVEVCAVEGLGGWGAFGVSDLWERWYPGGTCGSIGRQARAAQAILTWRPRHPVPALREEPRVMFGRYIGARAGWRHPEAQRRAAIFWTVRDMVICACSPP